MNYFPAIRFLLRFYLHQTISPPVKRFLGYFCFLLFLAVSTLFYQYIETYRDYYLEKLKGVYPQYFIQTQGRNIDDLDGFSHSLETFEFSNTFNFKFAPGTEQKSIIDVGVRSSQLPPADVSLDQNEEISWDNGRLMLISDRLYSRISSSSAYGSAGLFLQGVDGELLNIQIKPFELFGDKSWIYMPKNLAYDVGYFPNIVSITPHFAIGEIELQQHYKEAGIPVSLWRDRLPFFTTVFYILLNTFFSGMLAGILTLFFVLNFSYIKDTLREFKKMIMFSSIYGLGILPLVCSFICFLIGWISILYTASFGVKIWINQRLAYLIPVIGNRLTPEFYPDIFAYLVFSLLIVSLLYVKYCYLRQVKILGG